jgi:hypothetical protein
MRIPRIEAPQIGVKVLRMDSESWITRQLESHTVALLLHYDLNYAVVDGLEGLRKVRDEALQRLVPGGVVVAVARACDSGQELAEKLVESGIPPAELGVSNLTNKEIACLRPSSCVFLPGVRVLPADCNSRTVDDFVRDVRKSSVNLELRGPITGTRRFVTKTLDVGLTWEA